MPLSFDITTEQKVVGITINPTTGGGNPATVEAGSLAVNTTQGDGTGVVEADGTISALSGSNPGTTILQVDADADLGAGVVTISDLITLNVISPLATNLNLGGGTVVPK